MIQSFYRQLKMFTMVKVYLLISLTLVSVAVVFLNKFPARLNRNRMFYDFLSLSCVISDCRGLIFAIFFFY